MIYNIRQGIKCFNLFMIPIFLDKIFETQSMWHFQVRFSSIKTPKNLVFFTLSKTVSSRMTLNVTIERTTIWVKTYVSSIYNKKEDFCIRRGFFFITGSCWPPDFDFTMRKCTSVQYSQIINKKPIVGIFCSKCGTFCNMTFSFLLILTTVFNGNPV